MLAEGVEARPEGGQAFLEPGRVELAVFEGRVVAGEGASSPARLVGDRAALFLERRLSLLGFGGLRLPAFPKVSDKMRLVW